MEERYVPPSSKKTFYLSGLLCVFVVYSIGLTLTVALLLNQEEDSAASGGPVQYGVALFSTSASAGALGAGATAPVMGTVQFYSEEGGVRVKAKFTGLAPKSVHGFQIHEYGDLSDSDGTGKLGGHYNPPPFMKHGCPGKGANRHAGDLGNLYADENGVATYDRVNPKLQLTGSSSIVGRAIVLHRDYDDCVSQPDGNAGPPLAVAVISIGDISTGSKGDDAVADAKASLRGGAAASGDAAPSVLPPTTSSDLGFGGVSSKRADSDEDDVANEKKAAMAAKAEADREKAEVEKQKDEAAKEKADLEKEKAKVRQEAEDTMAKEMAGDSGDAAAAADGSDKKHKGGHDGGSAEDPDAGTIPPSDGDTADADFAPPPPKHQKHHHHTGKKHAPMSDDEANARAKAIAQKEKDAKNGDDAVNDAAELMKEQNDEEKKKKENEEKKKEENKKKKEEDKKNQAEADEKKKEDEEKKKKEDEEKKKKEDEEKKKAEAEAAKEKTDEEEKEKEIEEKEKEEEQQEEAKEKADEKKEEDEEKQDEQKEMDEEKKDGSSPAPGNAPEGDDPMAAMLKEMKAEADKAAKANPAALHGALPPPTADSPMGGAMGGPLGSPFGGEGMGAGPTSGGGPLPPPWLATPEGVLGPDGRPLAPPPGMGSGGSHTMGAVKQNSTDPELMEAPSGDEDEDDADDDMNGELGPGGMMGNGTASGGLTAADDVADMMMPTNSTGDGGMMSAGDDKWLGDDDAKDPFSSESAKLQQELKSMQLGSPNATANGGDSDGNSNDDDGAQGPPPAEGDEAQTPVAGHAMEDATNGEAAGADGDANIPVQGDDGDAMMAESPPVGADMASGSGAGHDLPMTRLNERLRRAN